VSLIQYSKDVNLTQLMLDFPELSSYLVENIHREYMGDILVFVRVRSMKQDLIVHPETRHGYKIDLDVSVGSSYMFHTCLEERT
jgi:hypothetical protein